MLLSMADVQLCAGNPSDVVLTNNRNSSNLLEIMYGLVQIKCLILIFPIHNMFDRNLQKNRTKVYKMINTNTARSVSPKIFRCEYWTPKIQKLENNSQSIYAEYSSISTLYIINTTSTWTLQFPHFKQLLFTVYTLPDANQTAKPHISKNKGFAFDRVTNQITYKNLERKLAQVKVPRTVYPILLFTLRWSQ